jgi:hypothetical protein
MYIPIELLIVLVPFDRVKGLSLQVVVTLEPDCLTSDCVLGDLETREFHQRYFCNKIRKSLIPQSKARFQLRFGGGGDRKDVHINST